MSAKQVLIIDDEENMRHMLEITLRKAGYRPETAADGEIGLQKMTREMEIPDWEIGVEVLKEDHIIGTFPISKKIAVFSKISPGSYTIRLTNGRVLWNGELTRENLLWTYAYPGKELRLAAETVAAEQTPTKIELFLDGELEMSVFAGLESGEMRIRVREA